MKRKSLISSFAVLLVVATVTGTMAYFTKNFSSDQNIAKAASFNVDVVNAQGKTIGNADFNLSEKLFPGMDPNEVYQFQIRKNDTEVPVEYKININPTGDLFPQDNSSPVKLTVQRQVDNKWVDLDDTQAFEPEKNIESFKVLVSWSHSDNDIDFQGKTGNIRLDVTATQVDAKPNNVTGNLVKTRNGQAPVEPAKSIVSYKFDEGYAPKMNPFKFYIYDGDGYVNEWYGSGTQKVIDGKVYPRTGVEVAEAIVKDIYITQKGFFTPLTEKWDVTNVGSEIIFTSKANKAYDNFKIVVPESENRAEIKGEFLKKQAGTEGKAAVKQVNTLTINGNVNKAGKLSISFDDGMEKVDKTIVVGKKDSTAIIAANIAEALSNLTGWNVTNATGSTDVVFTAKTAAADKDVTVTLENK